MTEKEMISNPDRGQNPKTLSEFESARLLAGFGIPTAKGILAQNLEEVRKAAEGIGYPVVLKVCSPEVSHKTESGLVAVDLRNEADLELAFHPEAVYVIVSLEGNTPDVRGFRLTKNGFEEVELRIS